SGRLRQSAVGSDEEFLEAAYWIVLGRPLDAESRKVRLRHFELGHSRDSVLPALLGSSEFRERYVGRMDTPDPSSFLPASAELDRALAALGTNRAFIDACYVCLLGRQGDAGGIGYYESLIVDRRLPRRDIVSTLLQSQEFADRYRLACPSG